MELFVYIIPVIGLAALLFSYFKSTWITKQSTGSEKMTRISAHIREGAIAFLKTEYKVLLWFIIIIAILLGYSNYQNAESSWLISVSFIVGALCSGLAGFLGMTAATKANVRTTEAAKKGLGPALQIAFSGGSIMGMNVVGLGVFGLSALFLFYSKLDWTTLKVINVLNGAVKEVHQLQYLRAESTTSAI